MSRSEEFEKFSREEIQKDPSISANEIIRKAQEKNIGIQRKKALEIIRQIKGKKKKPHAYKYTPKKYRKGGGGIPKRKQYMARIHIGYYDSYREYQEKWITTGTYPDLKSVYKELWIYETRLRSLYDVDTIDYMNEVIYERRGNKFIPIRENYLR
ncbi:MAG: hypothetical protein QXV17_14310 [Candidatus Micrarchaeaceae archaeon]